MTNLLGLVVHRGQQVLGKQNHSSSVTLEATSGPPSLYCPSGSHQVVSQMGSPWDLLVGTKCRKRLVSGISFRCSFSPKPVTAYLPAKTVQRVPIVSPVPLGGLGTHQMLNKCRAHLLKVLEGKVLQVLVPSAPMMPTSLRSFWDHVLLFPTSAFPWMW